MVIENVNRQIKIISRTIWPDSTKLGTKYTSVKGVQFCSNEGPFEKEKDSHIA